MSTTKNNHEPLMNQPPQPPTPTSSSFLSNYKWWFVSFALIFLISFVIQRQLSNKNDSGQGHRLFTAEELQMYTKDELYLAILGHVFNVSSAPRFYSSTGSYRFYTGRDASRSFYTGKSSPEDLIDDLSGLDDEAIAGIYKWFTFYQNRYPHLGQLIGRYFNSDGTPTEYYYNVLKSVGHMQKRDEERAEFDKQWPACNSEWSQESGRRVWCTNKSGGIERSWVGLPRRYFDSSTQLERCVCVENPNKDDGRFKEYKKCSSTSSECRIFD